MRLRDYIQTAPKSWAESLAYRDLQSRYQDAYLELLKEISAERYEQEWQRLNRKREDHRIVAEAAARVEAIRGGPPK